MVLQQYSFKETGHMFQDTRDGGIILTIGTKKVTWYLLCLRSLDVGQGLDSKIENKILLFQRHYQQSTIISLSELK